MKPVIREETPADVDAIRSVNTDAFDRDAEAKLVDALRAASALVLSLVAEADGGIVGHIAFSPVVVAPHAIEAGARRRVLRDTTRASAPARSSAFFGSASSLCSKPSSTRMAIFFPLRLFDMMVLLAHSSARVSQWGCWLVPSNRWVVLNFSYSPSRAASRVRSSSAATASGGSGWNRSAASMA